MASCKLLFVESYIFLLGMSKVITLGDWERHFQKSQSVKRGHPTSKQGALVGLVVLAPDDPEGSDKRDTVVEMCF